MRNLQSPDSVAVPLPDVQPEALAFTRLFQASSANRAFKCAHSTVKGGIGWVFPAVCFGANSSIVDR